MIFFFPLWYSQCIRRSTHEEQLFNTLKRKMKVATKEQRTWEIAPKLDGDYLPEMVKKMIIMDFEIEVQGI